MDFLRTVGRSSATYDYFSRYHDCHRPQADETFSYEVIEQTLDAYKEDLESFDARIQMRFSFPMKVQSLRSGLSGFQYYDCVGSRRRRRGAQKVHASRLCLFLHLPVFIGAIGTCTSVPRAIGDTAFAAVRGPCLDRDHVRSELPVVRGFDRPLPCRRANGDAGDGETRGRAGFCRIKRRQSDFCGRRRAILL